jgi:hypothetical protein
MPLGRASRHFCRVRPQEMILSVVPGGGSSGPVMRGCWHAPRRGRVRCAVQLPGNVGGLDELPDLVPKAIARGERSGQNDRIVSVLQLVHNRGERALEFRVHAHLPFDPAEGLAGHRGANHRHVSRVVENHDVRRLALRQRFTNDALHLSDGTVRRDHGLGATRCLDDGLEVAVHAVSKCVLGDQALFRDASTWLSRQKEYGHAMSPGSHQSVHEAQLAHAVGGAQEARTLQPGIAIDCIRRIQLVGAPDPIDVG